jgi:hypothetical protein
MTAKARKLIRRTAAAVQAGAQISTDIAYEILNGALDLAHLVRTGDMLDRLGIDLSDGQASWYGRHVAKAYRAAHDGQSAPKAWVRHRTTGRRIHVYVYAPNDSALIEGLRAYKATRAMVTAADFTEAA